MPNPTPVPSNVPRTLPAPAGTPAASSVPVPSNGPGGPRIKVESNSPYESQGLGQTTGISNYGNPVAQQQAAQNLKEKFGANANVQINQLQAQAAKPGLSPLPHHPSPQNIQLPPQMSDQQRKESEQKRQQQQQRQYQPLQQSQTVPSVQTDGANDWDAAVIQQQKISAKNPSRRSKVDRILRRKVDQMANAMEGGGLMLPLSERSSPDMDRRGAYRSTLDNNSKSSSSSLTQTLNTPKISRYDGLDDSGDENIKDDPDLDDDEDAINSDLDDPDEVLVDEGEEEGQKGQVMLCTYDKVQRVKAKWKCTLKDGVLTTGGKE